MRVVTESFPRYLGELFVCIVVFSRVGYGVKPTVPFVNDMIMSVFWFGPLPVFFSGVDGYLFRTCLTCL